MSSFGIGRRSEYSLLDLSNIWPRFHWRHFSRLLRIYIDTPQIEVELYGGTLRQIFMLGSEYFSILKNYRSKLHRAEDWPTLVIYRQLKHSLLQQFVQATNFLLLLVIHIQGQWQPNLFWWYFSNDRRRRTIFGNLRIYSRQLRTTISPYTLRQQLWRAQVLILWVRALHARSMIALYHSLIALA